MYYVAYIFRLYLHYTGSDNIIVGLMLINMLIRKTLNLNQIIQHIGLLLNKCLFLNLLEGLISKINYFKVKY